MFSFILFIYCVFLGAKPLWKALPQPPFISVKSHLIPFASNSLGLDW